MNRDEQRSRPVAGPPAPRAVAGGLVIAPSDPGGGTWIGVNDHGVTLALLNWYAVRARVATGALSRGLAVDAALSADAPGPVARILGSIPLVRVNPFRLLGFFPDRQVIEWRWDLSALTSTTHRWELNLWASSGFDEPGAERARRRAFAAARRAGPVGLPWVRGLHRSHWPEAGPYSICMHRADAVTVSYTEIRVAGTMARLRYVAGSPCASEASEIGHLELARPGGARRFGV